MISVERIAGERWAFVDKRIGPVRLYAHYHGTLRDVVLSVRVGGVAATFGNNAGGETLLNLWLKVTRR